VLAGAEVFVGLLLAEAAEAGVSALHLV
jgi:hypothetical protein